MKKLFTFLTILISVSIFSSCTRTESDFTVAAPESISIKSDATDIIQGASVTFTVISSIDNAIIASGASIFINGTQITGNTYTFPEAGTFVAFASKGTLNSTAITIRVTANNPSSKNFIHRVLVEEYSGTWCGNCPAILYGVDLLHQQTDKTIVVSTHLFNGDPFITTQGNSLAANLGITGVPSGRINRTVTWNGLQYRNVDEVLKEIKSNETTGLAISSSVSGNHIDATITVSYAVPITGNTRLTVYLVEDKLMFTQRNYSSNLYAGQPNIPNFEYNGVIRSIVSDLSGDPIANNGVAVQKTYSFDLPSNVSSLNNLRIVAFATNESGAVLNAQQAKTGAVQPLEIL